MDRRSFLCRSIAPLALAAPVGCTTAVRTRGVREFQLVAMAGQALTDTGKPAVPAWTYGGSVPGPQLRVRQGDRVRVEVTNRLQV
ncbi:MAG: copper oxidase, partial [Arthrobacter sp.]|nr:copper oxidase [Arthrobacter sp.]